MSFDNSRFTFDSWQDYFGVVMEQGRVQVDSDWNEWLAELSRRIQAGTMDTIGRAVFPSTTPYAFKITPSTDSSGNHLAIGAGRYYVDGLLVENHGPAPAAQFDPALNELSGAPQVAGAAPVYLDYTKQPYLPGAVLPAGNGPFLVYLDVWRRAITYLEDSNLVDKAVGVDTTGRLQTVWQVKLLDVSKVSGGVDCSTPDSSIDAWQKLTQPSGGLLSNGVVTSTPSGPCCLTPNTGYTGIENQFYRVEIHRGGTLAKDTTSSRAGISRMATFKWSRDNASVETGVTGIETVTNTAGNPASSLTVLSLGRDQMLGFKPGNWIEITDDYLELRCEPGELHLIDSIDVAARTITLDSTVSATRFPVVSNQADPARHTRIRRWDQSGKVYQSDGVTVWADLGAAGATGDIPVPPAGTSLILESGITVSVDVDGSGAAFRSGNFWTFAARTADGSVESLTKAYPRGILHHYARLSVVTFPSTATDCRIEWPPSAGSGCCGCTVTVRPGDMGASKSLQDVIDQYQNLDSLVEICLAPGNYSLGAPLRFTAAHSYITLKACQEGTAVIRAEVGKEDQFADGVVVLDGTTNVTLSGLKFAMPRTAFKPANGRFAGLLTTSLDPDVNLAINQMVTSIGVRAVGCAGLTIENCEFRVVLRIDAPKGRVFPFAVAILATGECSDWTITGNTFLGSGDFCAGFLLVPRVWAKQPAQLRASALSNVAGSAPVGSSESGDVASVAPAPAEAIRVSDVLQSAFSRGPSLPNLAAAGGTVLPASLDVSVFRDNTFSRLTIAVLAVVQPQTIDFVANTVEACVAGVWLISPAQILSILADQQGIVLLGLTIALGYQLPNDDAVAASQAVKVPVAPAATFVYTGAENYTDSQREVWTRETAAKNLAISGGTQVHPSNPLPSITGALPASTDQPLYRSERYGDKFSYTFSHLLPGYYSITLKFAEIVHTDNKTNKGTRIFNVSVNGARVLTSFDLASDAGAADAADDYTFSGIVPNAQGQIAIQFTGTSQGSDTNAKISAISIAPQWNGNMPNTGTYQPAASGSTEFQYFYVQLAQLAQQGFAGLQLAPMRLRLSENEMNGLSSTAVLVLGNDATQNGNLSSVLMQGNRMSSSVAIGNVFGVLSELTGQAAEDLTTSAYSAITQARYFITVATVSSVARCIVTGNMILNTASSKDQRVGASFMLDDSYAAPPSSTVPAPEIMVSANVFQGRLLILPATRPVSGTGIPAALTGWAFLNSVTQQW